MLNNFSPNMLKTFDDCQMKFYLRYVRKLSIPQKSSIFEKGKKVHALANYYLNGEDISKMEKVLNTSEKEAWERLKNNEYLKLKTVHTEYNLSCKVGDFWVGGRLDALMSDNLPLEDKCLGEKISYTILDYKTGSIPKSPEYDFQTMVYLLAADKFLTAHGGFKSLRFIYINLKTNEDYEIIYSKEKKKEYSEKIIKICQNINFAIDSTVFDKKKDCSLCEYKNICYKF